MPETGFTIVAATYPDYETTLGDRYDNVFGLASLIFAVIRSQGKQHRRGINFRRCANARVISIISVTAIVIINNVIHVTGDTFIV